MLTHVNPSVAVCEQKSGQIWPQKGSLGTLFRPNLAGYRAVGPHPAPCGQSWEVFTHYEATFEISRYVGFHLEPVRAVWGAESLFMGTLAPLSRLCAFMYTVPPLAGVHMRSTHIPEPGAGRMPRVSVHPLPSPHSPRTGSKGNPT